VPNELAMNLKFMPVVPNPAPANNIHEPSDRAALPRVLAKTAKTHHSTTENVPHKRANATKRSCMDNRKFENIIQPTNDTATAKNGNFVFFVMIV
jgi:hypothetical protein